MYRIYFTGATHLFLPCVTHSSAIWRRSETLRDRPSPVVPFTVPNKESVSGNSRCLYPLQAQAQRLLPERKNLEKHGNEAGWGNATCPFSLQPLSFFCLYLVKSSGKAVVIYNYKSSLASRDNYPHLRPISKYTIQFYTWPLTAGKSVPFGNGRSSRF